jgi:hypothetical protein
MSVLRPSDDGVRAAEGPGDVDQSISLRDPADQSSVNIVTCSDADTEFRTIPANRLGSERLDG